ncbi:MAG: M50 family metallopeptidase [Nanoarchaeota archaeon]|nr:M50 family metallopeptidase [Nanoarchaeota archaeon]
MSIINKIKDIGKYVALGLAGLYTFNSLPAKALDLTPKPAKVLQLDNLELKLEMPKQGLEKKFLPKLSPIYEIDKEEPKKEKIENDDIDWTNYFVEVPLNTFGSFILTVFAHELGHATTAKLLGCEDVRLHGPDLSKGLFGASSYTFPKNRDLTKNEQNLISAYGTGTTSSLSDLLYQAIKEDNVPDSLKQLTATASLMMLADRHRYLWSSALKNYLRMEIDSSNDFHSIMKRSVDNRLSWTDINNQGFFHGVEGLYQKDKDGNPVKLRFYADKEGKFRELIKKYDVETIKKMPDNIQKKLDISYGVALGASLLELGLRWEEIAFLTQTALGMDAKKPEGFNLFHAGFYPIENGFFISLDGTW